jgi:predicted enzyme related to lactoylglutathione lyase
MSTAKKKAAASIIWFEIPTDDLDRARTFYSKLFGWKIGPFPGMPGPEAQNYLHIDTGGEDASPDGGMMKRMHPQQPITNYVNVPSVTESMAKVEKLGGKVCVPKTAVMQMGYFAICQDTEGNTFALWERNDKTK